jgi:hypothetical protein
MVLAGTLHFGSLGLHPPLQARRGHEKADQHDGQARQRAQCGGVVRDETRVESAYLQRLNLSYDIQCCLLLSIETSAAVQSAT